MFGKVVSLLHWYDYVDGLHEILTKVLSIPWIRQLFPLGVFKAV